MNLKSVKFVAVAVASQIVVSQTLASELGDALMNGKVSLNMRLRYEQVDQANIANTADASTIRTRLGYLTGTVSGLSAFIEMEDVHKFVVDDYNTPSGGVLATDLGPKNANFPIVADPIGTELNQSFLQYKSGKSTSKFGRQRIIRGNARFIGNVGWRQNEQTFDGFSYQNNSENLSIFAAYVSNRNTITFTDIDMDTSLFDLSYNGAGGGTLTAYYYDIAVDAVNGAFWETTGLRYAGKSGPLSYALEYATQDRRDTLQPDYSLVELAYQFEGFSATVGVETLGSDELQLTPTTALRGGFATPLATLHKFNGWADVFLATPSDGLEDSYFKIAGKSGNTQLALIFHDFAADTGGLDYGDEIDFLMVNPISKEFKIGLKYAAYSAGDPASGESDVDKIWLWAEFGF